jgi:hypothetical protein
MIADALRLEVERYAASMPTTNPLFARALAGTLTPTHMAWYLTNFRRLLVASIPHMRRAAERSADLGDRALEAHYRNKIGEEVGHDAWADNDLAAVSSRTRIAGDPRVVPSVIDRIEESNAVIDEHPALFLAYMFFAEYLIVLLGDEWLEALEKRCGIPTSSMTAVGNHVEADRHHTEEALDSIDALVGDPRMLPRMREVLRSSIAFFDRFCAEVVGEGDRALTAARSSHAAVLEHAPAA